MPARQSFPCRANQPLSGLLQYPTPAFIARPADAGSGLLQHAGTDDGGSIIEVEIHLAKRPKPFKQTVPPLTILLMIGLLFVLMLIGVPVAISLALVSYTFVATNDMPPMIVLVIGCFMETIAAITIVTLMTGLLTPPVGMVLHVLSKVAKVPFEQCVRAPAPFIVPLVVVLLQLNFVPAFSMWLPTMLYR